MSARLHHRFAPRNGLLLLLPAAVALVYSNGRWPFAVSALAAMFLFRLFLLTQPVIRGIALGLIVHIAAHTILWVGIIPAPGWLYYAICAAYGLTYFLPFIVDRLLAFRISGFKSTLVLPLAWFITEILVQRLTPYGSWASAGYTLAGPTLLMQVIAFSGIAGAGFVMSWLSSTVAWLVYFRPPRVLIKRTVLAWTLIGSLILVGGALRMRLADPPAQSVRIAMILPSAELTQELNGILYSSLGTGSPDDSTMGHIRSLSRRIRDDLLEQSRVGAEAGAQIIVWSELAGRVLSNEENRCLEQAGILAQEFGVYLFLSLGTWRPGHHPPLENNVVAVTPDGRVAWSYAKARPIVGAEAHLLPPAHDSLPTLETPHGRLGVVICHDLDFPDFVRKAGQKQVNLLLGPSADWSRIKTLHARMAVTRAIENGVTLVRPTYSGLSIVADPYGRILSQWDDSVSSDRMFIAQVPIYNVRTVYSSTAAMLPWLAAGALVGLLFVATRTRSGPSRQASSDQRG